MAREHKGCTSASCCSPARLWRTLQTMIKSDNKADLISFFNDEIRQEHIVRVALTSRLTNDPSQLPPSHRHTIIKLPKQDGEFKKFTDLNSLQLALITASEPVVLALLSQLKLHASLSELEHFVNHVFGKGHSSLDLALFLKYTRVVKVLLSLGAKSHKKCILKQKDETPKIPVEKNPSQALMITEEKTRDHPVTLLKTLLLRFFNKQFNQPVRSVYLDPLKKPPDKSIQFLFVSTFLFIDPCLSLKNFF